MKVKLLEWILTTLHVGFHVMKVKTKLKDKVAFGEVSAIKKRDLGCPVEIGCVCGAGRWLCQLSCGRCLDGLCGSELASI